MARAAVKAKQQAKAKAAQPTKTRARGRRRHSGGGNPNQDLFFVRLRRHQRWVYAALAVVFGLSFVLVGVGSGGNGGLIENFTGLFGGSGSSSVSKAQDEIKKDPVKGYQDLALAYEEKGDLKNASEALKSYLVIRKTDAATWATLAGLEMSQGTTFATQYQNAQQAAQTADPSAPFLPGGILGSAVGQNPTYQGASQDAATRTSLLYQKAVGAYGDAVTHYQRASKLRPKNTSYLQQLATAAQNAGNTKVTVNALKRYLKVDPNAPQRKRIEQQIAALQQPSTPIVQSGGGG
jgi:tetratricopeptide (TPR) repeat protein